MSNSARALRLSSDLLRRAVAVELGHIGIDSSVAELATPDYLGRQIRYMTRGASRNECLDLIGHLAMLVRMFAAEVPVGRRDQMLCELDDYDAALGARRSP